MSARGGDTNSGLVDLLVKQGVLSQDEGEEVKLKVVQTGKSEKDIIKSLGLVSSLDLAKAEATLHNFDFVDLSSIPLSPEAMSVLPKEIAERFKVFPISIDKAAGVIDLAMANPLDLFAIEFVEQKTGFKVKPFVADENQIDEFVTVKYATSLSKEVAEALRDVSADSGYSRVVDVGKQTFIKEEKIAEIVRNILDFAVRSRASDIHIEPQEKTTRVRYRIDGILQEKLSVPKPLHDSLVSRIKILSGLKIDEKRVPQDGRFNFSEASEDVDLRVSTLPTAWGEKVVMRLLKKTGGVPDLPELGLRGLALKNLEEAILRPHGIIIICGPTGSGKTTTLYSIISRINTPKVNIVTLEDPIEYKIPGVNQVQVNPAAGLTFASGLRAFLRQDPNIILVGEIRDRETADLAIQASLTGHLVFSTLHTNDASGALPRLLDMGAEPYLLASSMTAVLAQRVVRKIHEDCKEEYEADEKVIKEIKEVLGSLWPSNKKDNILYRGKGCAGCGDSGYYGRIGIFEVMPVTEKISRMILERSPAAEIEKQARSEGMVTMKQDGYLKVIEGISTIEEVLRVAQE